MLKQIAVGAGALIVVACAAAYAQQPPSVRDFGARLQLRADDRAAFLDARLAALHAGLRLTPDQEKEWPAYEQAYRDLAASERAFTPRSEGQNDPIARAQRAADQLAARSAALRHYAEAAAPLYQSLDDNQKRRFNILSRVGRPRFHNFAFGRGGRDDSGDARPER
jgi:hypothetical protein